jgi:hypothetical protein
MSTINGVGNFIKGLLSSELDNLIGKVSSYVKDLIADPATIRFSGQSGDDILWVQGRSSECLGSDSYTRYATITKETAKSPRNEEVKLTRSVFNLPSKCIMVEQDRFDAIAFEAPLLRRHCKEHCAAKADLVGVTPLGNSNNARLVAVEVKSKLSNPRTSISYGIIEGYIYGRILMDYLSNNRSDFMAAFNSAWARNHRRQTSPNLSEVGFAVLFPKYAYDTYIKKEENMRKKRREIESLKAIDMNLRMDNAVIFDGLWQIEVNGLAEIDCLCEPSPGKVAPRLLGAGKAQRLSIKDVVCQIESSML